MSKWSFILNLSYQIICENSDEKKMYKNNAFQSNGQSSELMKTFKIQLIHAQSVASKGQVFQ